MNMPDVPIIDPKARRNAIHQGKMNFISNLIPVLAPAVLRDQNKSVPMSTVAGLTMDLAIFLADKMIEYADNPPAELR